ncbi:ACS family phthalate transporter-like MFS transporter [Rhodobium gokarnense]|uniref:ACS family phthalate transporter-like MFS transporter n=1 Tax=Rhodobium gokarnense TaxID=364296 RepID=A0ABT3H7N9_9HYPH|nr:ACS family phthalate transporter-like MFS transporter [Rhodobium gokarnense]
MAFAKLQFIEDLSFGEFTYGFGAGVFYLGYALFEMPSNLYLDKHGAKITLSRIMILWGAISASTAFMQTPTHYYILRFLLGVAEAGAFPGIILYLSYWFPAERRGRITSLFAMGAPVSGIFGSLISGWLLTLDGLHGLRGWQILLIYEGIPAILIGIFVFFYIDNRPEDAKWLTAKEKKCVADTVAASEKKPEKGKGHVLQALLDPRIYVLGVSYLAVLAGCQAVALWIPTILKGIGTDASLFGVLTAIPFVMAVVAMNVWGWHSDKKMERRWHFAAVMWAAGISLAVLSYFADSVTVTILLLCIATGGIWASVTVFWTIPPTYLSSSSKAGGIGFVSSCGAAGGFLSPIIVGWSNNLAGSFYGGLAAIGILLVISGVIVLVAVPAAALRTSQSA